MTFIPAVTFSSNDQAAHAVHSYIHDNLRPPVRHLTPRPYNFRSPKVSEWWLVPVTSWPAYGHSKLFFARFSEWEDTEAVGEQGGMFTGFRFTRGLGRQLEGLAPQARLMQPDWFWRRFLNDALAGVFAAPLRALLARAGLPIHLRLDLYRADNLPDPALGSSQPDDRLAFIISEETLTLKAVRFAEGPSAPGPLAALTGVARLGELALQLESLPDLSWYWVDIALGMRVHYGDEERGDWHAANLWHHALEPWLPWVV